MGLKLSEIVQLVYPARKYFKKVYTKTQIVLHHTVSGKGVKGDIAHWIKSKFNIGTCVIISRNGTINQTFSSRYWAYHLGVKGYVYKKLRLPYKRRDMNSIGIEIDSYGGLRRNSKGQWETVYGNVISNDLVIEYPSGYRGYYAYEKYTSDQIKAVKNLLIYWSKVYSIPLDYQANMWELNADALGGKPGVWSHTSYRPDKSDVHPQPELIKMLKSLKYEQ